MDGRPTLANEADWSERPASSLCNIYVPEKVVIAVRYAPPRQSLPANALHCKEDWRCITREGDKWSYIHQILASVDSSYNKWIHTSH